MRLFLTQSVLFWLWAILFSSFTEAAVLVRTVTELDLQVVRGESRDTEVDLNGDGTVDIIWSTVAGFSTILLSSDSQFETVIVPSPGPLDVGGAVAALPFGYDIGPDLLGASYQIGVDLPAFDFDHEWYISPPNVVRDFYRAEIMLCFASGCAGFFRGQDAYIGFSFQDEDGIHYGWIEIDGPGVFPGSLFTEGGQVIRIAYETTAGRPIRAGVIPEPSTLLFLVLTLTLFVTQIRTFE
ncbi:MAG: hypothetical protein AAGA96_10570 [Verrucomicrobiota bacterium]